MKQCEKVSSLSIIPSKFRWAIMVVFLTACLALRASAQGNKSEAAPDVGPTNTIVTSIPMPVDLDYIRGMTLSPNGGTLYLSIDGGIFLINTATYSLSPANGGGDGAEGIVVTPDGKYLYQAVQTGYNTGGVLIFLTSSFGTGTFLATPYNTNAMGINPAGTLVYALTGGEEHPASIAVIDTATQTITTNIPVGNEVYAVAFAPDGKTAYVIGVSSDLKPGIFVIDVASSKVTSEIGIPDLSLPPIPPNCVISPKGNELYVATTPGPDNDNAIGALQNKKIRTLYKTNDVAIGNLALTPNGKYLYFVETVGAGDEIFVLDTQTHKVGSPVTFPVDTNLYYLTISPNGEYLYAADDYADDPRVWVIQVTPAQ
jgi:DNA-binding beta-propeller fold protein YncE